MNEPAAQADAASLLSALPLPPGATHSALEPAGDDSVLAHPGEGPPVTPNVVDDSAWWLVPGAPATVLAYIAAHRPAGTTLALKGFGSTGTNGASFESEGIEWPPIRNILTMRWLVLEAVQLPGGSTGLRADAQVVWLTPRPVSEQIPPGSSRLRVSVRDTIPVNRPRRRVLTVTSPRALRRIVALLNALPAAQPGVKSCPADFGVIVRLALYARRGARPLAVALVDPSGCGGVELTIGGRRQPSLEGEGLPGAGPSTKVSLTGLLDSVLGVKLNTGP